MSARPILGPTARFAGFVLVLLLIGALAQTGRRSTIDHAMQLLWWLFVIACSAVLVVRMIRQRRDPDAARRAVHSGQLGAVPERWQGWVLGEDDRRR
jgi:hypothetical protein